MAITPRQVENAATKKFNDACVKLENVIDEELESGKVVVTIPRPYNEEVVQNVIKRFIRAGWDVTASGNATLHFKAKS